MSVDSPPISRPRPEGLVANMQAVLLFDGDCPACSAFVRGLVRLDRGLRVLSLSETASERLRLAIGLPEGYDESIVLVEPRIVRTRRAAFARLADRLGLPWRLAGAVRWIPEGVFTRLYAVVGRYRRRIPARRCPVPTAEDRACFGLTPNEEQLALAWIGATA